MSLIPEVSLSDFRRLVKKPAGKLKEYQSFHVVADGQAVCTVIIPPAHDAVVADTIRTRAEYLAHTANSLGGKAPEAPAT